MSCVKDNNPMAQKDRFIGFQWRVGSRRPSGKLHNFTSDHCISKQALYGWKIAKVTWTNTLISVEISYHKKWSCALWKLSYLLFCYDKCLFCYKYMSNVKVYRFSTYVPTKRYFHMKFKLSVQKLLLRIKILNNRPKHIVKVTR